MRQVLKIDSVPAKIHIESIKARLHIRNARPKLHIVRNINGLNIRTHPAKISISNRAVRESILAMKSTMSLMKEHAAEGIRAAQEATAKNVEKGNAMGDVLHTSIADIAASNFISTIETGLVFIPQEGPEVSFSDPSVEIEYTPDNLEFNWEISSPEFNYVPYDINVSVEQYPRVDIEYVGEPNYFPQNPNLLEAQLEEFKEEANSDEE